MLFIHDSTVHICNNEKIFANTEHLYIQYKSLCYINIVFTRIIMRIKLLKKKHRKIALVFSIQVKITLTFKNLGWKWQPLEERDALVVLY